jgi:REP element-mobilizing transposase RayT
VPCPQWQWQYDEIVGAGFPRPIQENAVRRHRERHQRRSIRLRDYDYSQAGYYYVSICTQDHESIFGKIIGSEMRLNRLGWIVSRCWFAIPDYYSNVELDLFVIMSNHFHGIIHITDLQHQRIQTGRGGVTPPLQKLRSPTLGDIIGYFKYRSTKHINQLSNSPGRRIWQRGYYEHVIRNEAELNSRRQYIMNNPLKWELDRNNPVNW